MEAMTGNPDAVVQNLSKEKEVRGEGGDGGCEQIPC
jgi:hypothetical protein